MNRLLAINGGLAHSERRAQRQRAVIGVLLVLCLLLAQWVGYAHAIAHAHVQGNASPHLLAGERGIDATSDANAKAGLFDHARASGACVALDAAALGAGPCTDIALLPVQRAAVAPVTVVLLHRWLAPFTANFASRAPPVNA